jgi:hypothetical protein
MALLFCIDHVVIDIYKNAPTNVPVQVLVQMILGCFFKVRDGNNPALLAHRERQRQRQREMIPLCICSYVFWLCVCVCTRDMDQYVELMMWT